ncbi:hypothetical protein MHYP_G00241860 [Metynnis hypsauchen]
MCLIGISPVSNLVIRSSECEALGAGHVVCVFLAHLLKYFFLSEQPDVLGVLWKTEDPGRGRKRELKQRCYRCFVSTRRRAFFSLTNWPVDPGWQYPVISIFSG